jgi:hypothetical protein
MSLLLLLFLLLVLLLAARNYLRLAFRNLGWTNAQRTHAQNLAGAVIWWVIFLTYINVAFEKCLFNKTKRKKDRNID